MSVAAATFESWGFETAPRRSRARGRVVEAVAQTVDLKREAPRSTALAVQRAPVPTAPPAVHAQALTPAAACAIYSAMAGLARPAPGRLVDETA